MGTFSVTVGVGDPEGRRFETLEALVDTGATNTVIPAALLSQLGVRAYRKSEFELADGHRTRMDIGRTWIRIDGQQEFTQVVFAPAAARPVIGAVTLEEMGLAVDPVKRRLVPVPKLLA